MANGGSPAAAKKQERLDAERLTLDHLADRYLHEYAYRFKRSAAEDDRSIRLHLRPVWGSRRYRDIRRSDVVEVVEKIYSSGRPALAVRLKATASKLFAFRHLGSMCRGQRPLDHAGDPHRLSRHVHDVRDEKLHELRSADGAGGGRPFRGTLGVDKGAPVGFGRSGFPSRSTRPLRPRPWTIS